MSYAELKIGMLLTALLVGMAASAVLYFRNKKQHYGKALTAALFVLRALAVAMVVLLLLNPYVRRKTASVEQPTIVLAHDNSASLVMGKDSTFYTTDYPTRLMSFYNRLQSDYQVDEYLFGQTVREGETLDFGDQLTDISGLLQSVGRRYYKRNVGAVVLFSDGIYNRGFDPELFAERFPFPIYTVVLGDTASCADLAVKYVHYNKQVALGAAYPIRVTVAARDLANRKATLTIKDDGRVVEKREIEIPSNRFSREEDFMLEATSKGVRQIDVELGGIAEEEALLNNVRHVFVEVLDQKYKMLCLAHAPHPDLSAIRSVLNDNYEVEFAFGNDRIPDFAPYDLVVLHQFPAADTDMTALKTQLQKYSKLPLFIVMGPSTDMTRLNEIQQAFRITDGAANTVLDVKAYANASFATFSTDAKLSDAVGKFPPLALPHVEVAPLVAHDDLLLQDVLGVKSGLPLLGFVSAGRKMAFLFGTNVWRWRLFEYHQSKSHVVFDGIFAKSIKYLLLDSDDGISVFCKETFYHNEAVVITAELRNLSNELVTDPELAIEIVNKLTGETYDFVFSKRENDYVLDVGVLPEGIYTYRVRSQMGDRAVSANGSFSVVAMGIEAQQLTADWKRMCNLAATTNGKCYLATEMQQLLADLQADTRITSVAYHETRLVDLIHTKWILFVLIALVALEWLLRKMFGTY